MLCPVHAQKVGNPYGELPRPYIATKACQNMVQELKEDDWALLGGWGPSKSVEDQRCDR